MVGRFVPAFGNDDSGATLVEFSLIVLMLLVVVLGFVDFGNALYQWNEASKAVQVGARLAAVSDPVASDITTIVNGLNDGITPGDVSKPYAFVCDGATLACPCLTSGCDAAVFSQDNLDRLVFGNDGNCGPPYGGAVVHQGMCDIFPRIQPANVVVEYSYSGLGYAFRPGGPIPTVQVRLQNLTFDFFFLGDLLGFGQLQIPAMTGTVTGEDLCTTLSC
jgi:Flp pilus assembly protein TadG